MNETEHEGSDRNVIRDVATVRPELVKHITPPEGTDVRAVQWREDPAPVVVGDVVIQA
jgi:hypothetical protein